MMDNKTYVDLVNAGEYPSEVQVPIDAPFVDERGEITNIWLGNSGSVTVITSKKGTDRANHWHSGDFHSSHIISGKIKYTESEIDGSNKQEFIFGPGESFFSPPMKAHRMDFLEDTVFVTVNGIAKNHANYENSVVRTDVLK